MNQAKAQKLKLLSFQKSDCTKETQERFCKGCGEDRIADMRQCSK